MNARLGNLLGATCTVAILASLAGCGSSPPPQGGSGDPGGSANLRVLSNRPDLVSAGDALVEIVTAPGGAVPAVQLNGRDITTLFARRPDGRVLALVTDLANGPNTLRSGPDAITITNHPSGGPVFSGPQTQPWDCQEGALDAQCNQPPVYSWLYKSSNPLTSGLQPYNTEAPATDVATTTTDAGIEVPFIVRVEVGYLNRDQYRISVLYQPGQDWTAFEPQQQWNRKLFIPHGGGCGASYGVGDAPTQDYSGTFSFLPPQAPISLGDSPTVALGRGFLVMSAAMANTGHNCSPAMNAEALMMAKERVIEQYGELRYTIGSGCSGGSIAQQTVANAYPGIYQGLIVTCSYPDTASPGAQFLDFHLLRLYFENPTRHGAGVVWTPVQWSAVEGHLLPVDAIVADEGLFKDAVNPSNACGHVDDGERYHVAGNPGGVRCDIFSSMEKLFGFRDPAVWSANEIALGRSFVGIPIDNVGIQYGLESLQQGLITPAMFVDLNAKIGALNIDAEPIPDRLHADLPALPNMYRTGWLNSADKLDTVAIIDHRGPDPGIAHDAQWAWATRARLMRSQGHHDNQVIWYGLTPLIGDPNYSSEALLAMDRWLAAVEADDRDVPLREKIVQDKPGDITDRCTPASALAAPDGIPLPLLQPTLDQLFGPILGPILFAASQGTPLVVDPALAIVIDPAQNAVCGLGIVGETLRTEFSTPRGVAGQSRTYDDHKCQLIPLNRADNYGPLPFSDELWAQMQAIFPEGVCDYSQPGVGKQSTVPWMEYADERGDVIYGGRPMSAMPVGVAPGWAAAAFRTRE